MTNLLVNICDTLIFGLIKTSRSYVFARARLLNPDQAFDVTNFRIKKAQRQKGRKLIRDTGP